MPSQAWPHMHLRDALELGGFSAQKAQGLHTPSYKARTGVCNFQKAAVASRQKTWLLSSMSSFGRGGETNTQCFRQKSLPTSYIAARGWSGEVRGRQIFKVMT